MTYPYDQNPMPPVLALKCPECSAKADFTFAGVSAVERKVDRAWFEDQKAFEVLSGMLGGRKVHLAIYYPKIHGDQLSHINDWPEGFSPKQFAPGHHGNRPDRAHRGSLICAACGLRRKHRLNWPEEAHFQIDYKGHVLWAFDRDHAISIRDFVASDERERGNYEHATNLLKLPSVFLTAKARDAVVKKLDTLLGAAS